MLNICKREINGKIKQKRNDIRNSKKDSGLIGSWIMVKWLGKMNNLLIELDYKIHVQFI
jgi:hypothetical protein